MTPEERAGMAAAIQEAIALACGAVREEHAQSLAEIRRATSEEIAVVRAQQQRADEPRRSSSSATSMRRASLPRSRPSTQC